MLVTCSIHVIPELEEKLKGKGKGREVEFEVEGEEKTSLAAFGRK